MPQEVTSDTLRSNVENVILENQKLSLKTQELEEQCNKVSHDNNKLKNLSESLEKQKVKLLEQNIWLEQKIDELKLEHNSQDSSTEKLDALQKDIYEYKTKNQHLVTQKEVEVTELEKELLQCQKDKEILNFELVKLQKSTEIKLQDIELRYKKEKANLNSSRYNDKPTKKFKASLHDAKKSIKKKLKTKAVKCHSDTEDVIDFPSKLKKEGKSKLNDFKQQIKALEATLEDKEQLALFLTSENTNLKKDFEQNLMSLNNVKCQIEKELAGIQSEFKELRIKHERLLLDQSGDQKDESEQLLQIKDAHAKMTVENDSLIREVERIKKQGFKPTDSMFRMVDDIEQTKAQLEAQYQNEIEELQQQMREQNSNYKQEMRMM